MAAAVLVATSSSNTSLSKEQEPGSPIAPILSSGLKSPQSLPGPRPGRRQRPVWPRYVQANLIVLPSRYAADFRLLCARNPVPCPLIAESAAPGKYDSFKSYVAGGADVLSEGGCVDLRHDIPRYMVYRDAELVRAEALDIESEWDDGDHVAFLIGCSYSFESALSLAGLVPRHTVLGRNVPMYRTRLPLCPAGVFTGSTYVVSMRPYKSREVEKVRRITRGYSATHGEPIAWGWEAVHSLGILDIDAPEWGEAPVTADGRPLGELQAWQGGSAEDEVPVFWACGVTPQEAVMRANIKGTVMAHAPGHMLLLDCKDHDIVNTS
ncbi:hypothetical protein PG997_001140 [Apiospora hydei]|uniref:DUF1445 domain-containing protein n=1 Tax=Apiospora hydei TaxID=1337664 RepID=A0ABR1XCS8_9PEZI